MHIYETPVPRRGGNRGSLFVSSGGRGDENIVETDTDPQALAAKFVARCFGLPVHLATLVAGLAGLGGVP